jgi:hypothetical protein
MFIETLLRGLPRSRRAKCAFRLPNVSLLRSAEVGLVIVVYKYLVPLGPKTNATKNADWFVTRTFESEH